MRGAKLLKLKYVINQRYIDQSITPFIFNGVVFPYLPELAEIHRPIHRSVLCFVTEDDLIKLRIKECTLSPIRVKG